MLVLFLYVFTANAQQIVYSISGDGSCDYCCALDAKWTNNIINKNHDRIYRQRFGGNRLYAWLKIRGGVQALEYIRVNRRLPIALEWYTDNGFDFGLAHLKTISLTDEDVRSIESESRNNVDHGWDFRVWDYREEKGYWKFIPRLESGLQMVVKVGNDPCELEIEFN